MSNLAEVCSRLAADRDARVQEIGRRCLRNYDEFQRLKYASLTPADAQHLVTIAETARTTGDTKRAKVLEQGAKVLGAEITRLRRPSKPVEKVVTKAAAKPRAKAAAKPAVTQAQI